MTLEAVRRGDEVLPAVQKAIAAKASFDICVLDIQMPDMSGYEVSRQIREQVDAMKEDRNKCLDAGMNDYMAKSIKREEVFNMVRKWVLEKEK